MAWALVAGLWALVLATVPFARAVQRALDRVGLRALFLVVAAAGVLVATAWVLRRVHRQGGAPWRLAVWAATGTAYLAAAWSLRAAPEEAMHLLEYGALGVAAWHALRFRIGDGWVHVAALGLGAAAGLLDEGLQWLAPGRHWDLRDLAINASAVTGVQVGLALGLRRPPPPRRARSGRRAAVGWLALAWLMLGASLLNTPDRIDAAGRHCRWLAGVRQRGDLMVEYGLLHEGPATGRFRSRLSLEELRATDRRRAREAARVLAREGADDRYEAFLARYNPITDPFLHELRVHLFRRDRYRETFARHLAQGEERWARRDATVAYRESQILETAFGHTLATAGRKLAPSEARLLREHALLERPYESRVSEGLITRFGPRAVVWTWGMGFLGLGLLALPRDSGPRTRGEPATGRPDSARAGPLQASGSR